MQKRFMQEQHRDSKFLLVGAIAAAVLLFIGFSFLGGRTEKNEAEAPENEALPAEAAQSGIPQGYVRRHSDGVPIPPDEQAENLYAVMIENSAEAWPLSGLAQARLVFEAPVEGSIPRFMAVFDDKQEVEKIGPVRSARPYYVEWADGLDALYTHVGGSPDGLSRVQQLGIPSLNEFFFGKFFWRSQDRYAPHNVYISTENLETAFAEKGYEYPELMTLFQYNETSYQAKNDAVASVTIPFSSASSQYDAKWVYQAEQNVFRRHQGDEVQQEQNGDEILAANVLVMFTDISVIDDIGRRNVRTSGEGKALLYRGGAEEEIRWQKSGANDALHFLTESGDEVLLNAGATWVEVVSTASNVSVDKSASE